MDKKENMIKEILFEMSAELESDNLIKLENVLRIKMKRCRIEEEVTELSTYIDDNDYIIKLFIANKRLENLSERSINQYVRATRNMLNYMNKNYKDITTNDIKYYLAMYQQNRKVSQNTLANIKRFLSSFFSWAADEEYIVKNPVRSIKAIKQQFKKKDFLTKEELVKMRDACKISKRDSFIRFSTKHRS
nr:phage integrase N-terminal SAM-like domain-containing protein [uncultured Anaerosporobacter sp.]